MSKHEIQEAAVEAAYCEIPDGAGRYIDQSDIRLMLEAAAPHLLAEAWEAGHRTCRLDPDSIEFNPYRARTDREPEPGDGPDYHAEHAAWETRQKK